MAELLKEEFDIETDLVSGAVGEFTVWINGTKVADKGPAGFPSEPEILKAAGALLQS